MAKTEEAQVNFGLVGRNISYSFSRGYFKKKFNDLGLTKHSYENFDLQEITEFPAIFKSDTNIKGLNVTIPYKEEVIPYLDRLDASADKIDAVNTIKVDANGLTGYNTDAVGFQKSLEPLLKKHHQKALILGTGGASKAIAFVLEKLDIDFSFVSRSGKNKGFTYEQLDENIIREHTLIINCSPVGTFPNIEEKPDLPYQGISDSHILYDLIYNPEETAFLKEGKKRGAMVSNGLRMLELQAEKAWEIWNS